MSGDQAILFELIVSRTKLRALEALCNDLDNLGDPDRLALKTSDVRRILKGEGEE